MRITVLTLLAILSVPGCRNPVGEDDLYVTVRRVADGLELTNRSSRTAYYFAADRDYLAFIDYAPCTTPSTCPGIEPGKTLQLPFTTILGYTPGTSEIMVSYWHFIQRGPGPGYDRTGEHNAAVSLR